MNETNLKVPHRTFEMSKRANMNSCTLETFYFFTVQHVGVSRPYAVKLKDLATALPQKGKSEQKKPRKLDAGFLP